MGKLIFFLVLFAVAAIFVRLLGSRPKKRDESLEAGSGARMVRCALCGVFHAEAETVLQNGKNFCSDDHARQGSRT